MKEWIYRGIKVDKALKLYNNSGTYYKKLTDSIDRLINLANKRGHKIIGTYNGSTSKILIDFGCEHGPDEVSIIGYKDVEVGCRLCAKDVQKGKQRFLDALNENGDVLIDDYISSEISVRIKKSNGIEKNIIPKKYTYYHMNVKNNKD